jgi:hypothetical protein
MRVGINYADDGAIGRGVLSFERKAGFFSSTPENKFAYSGAHRVDSNQRLARGLKVLVQRLDDQQLATFKRFVLNGRHNSADDACELHNQ